MHFVRRQKIWPWVLPFPSPHMHPPRLQRLCVSLGWWKRNRGWNGGRQRRKSTQRCACPFFMFAGASQLMLCLSFPIHEFYLYLKTAEISQKISPILKCRIIRWLWLIKLCLSVFSDFFKEQILIGVHIWVCQLSPTHTFHIFPSFLFNSALSIISYFSSPSPQSTEEHPHIQILVADWFLESWWEATSSMPGGGECNLASLHNPLKLIHRMSLFLKSTYYLTWADAIR